MAETLFSDASSGERERRRITEAIGRLRAHYVVCGYGRVGSTVARQLSNGGGSLVIIDVNAASLVAARADGAPGRRGRRHLRRHAPGGGHRRRARGLITTTDSDANNVYVTLSARALNKNLFIVARANDESAEDKLRQAGADRVVSPYARAGRQIAELATRPRVADFIDFALSHSDMSFSIGGGERDRRRSPGRPQRGRAPAGRHPRPGDRPGRPRVRGQPARGPTPGRRGGADRLRRGRPLRLLRDRS